MIGAIACFLAGAALATVSVVVLLSWCLAAREPERVLCSRCGQPLLTAEKVRGFCCHCARRRDLNPNRETETIP